MSVKHKFMLLPITEKNREALGLEAEFKDGGMLGILLPPSRIREGIQRWDKHGCPHPYLNHETPDTLLTLDATIQTLVDRAEAAKQVLLDEFQKEYEKLNTEHETTLEAGNSEAEKNAKFQARRMTVKDSKITELQETLNAEKQKTRTYELDFGDIRTRPLNWIQRFIGRLFRILA